MAKYRIASGKHYTRNKDGTEEQHVKGDVLEMSADEVKKWDNKFELVAEVEVEGRKVVAPAVAVAPAPAPAPTSASAPAARK